MEKLRSLKSVKEGIARKFDVAKQHALAYEEAIHIMDEIAELKSDKDIDSSEKISELEKKLQASIVTVNTLNEFKILLGKTNLSSEDAQHTLAHENAHANIAESIGADEIDYNLMICKGTDHYMYNAWASFRHPSDWSKDPEKIPNLIRIFNAPAEYGNDLSDEDSEAIERLQDMLSKMNQ